MNATITPFGSVPDEFGLCPRCRRSDGYLNIGREHFGVCHRHRVQWRIGDNLFSDWRDEDEPIWRRNERLLAGYREVRPFHRRRLEPTP